MSWLLEKTDLPADECFVLPHEEDATKKADGLVRMANHCLRTKKVEDRHLRCILEVCLKETDVGILNRGILAMYRAVESKSENRKKFIEMAFGLPSPDGFIASLFGWCCNRSPAIWIMAARLLGELIFCLQFIHALDNSTESQDEAVDILVRLSKCRVTNDLSISALHALKHISNVRPTWVSTEGVAEFLEAEKTVGRKSSWCVLQGQMFCGKTRIILEAIIQQPSTYVEPDITLRVRSPVYYTRTDTIAYLKHNTTIVVANDSNTWVQEASKWTNKHVVIAPCNHTGMLLILFFTDLISKQDQPDIIIVGRQNCGEFFERAKIVFGESFVWRRVVFDHIDIYDHGLRNDNDDDIHITTTLDSHYRNGDITLAHSLWFVKTGYAGCLADEVIGLLNSEVEQNGPVKRVTVEFDGKHRPDTFQVHNRMYTWWTSARGVFLYNDNFPPSKPHVAALALLKHESVAMETIPSLQEKITAVRVSTDWKCAICLATDTSVVRVVHEKCMNAFCYSCFVTYIRHISFYAMAENESGYSTTFEHSCPYCRTPMSFKDLYHTNDIGIEEVARLCQLPNLHDLQRALHRSGFDTSTTLAILLAHLTIHDAADIVWVIIKSDGPDDFMPLAEFVSSALPVHIPLPRVVTVSDLRLRQYVRRVDISFGKIQQCHLDVDPSDYGRIHHVVAISGESWSPGAVAELVENSIGVAGNSAVETIKLMKIDVKK